MKNGAQIKMGMAIATKITISCFFVRKVVFIFAVGGNGGGRRGEGLSEDAIFGTANVVLQVGHIAVSPIWPNVADKC